MTLYSYCRIRLPSADRCSSGFHCSETPSHDCLLIRVISVSLDPPAKYKKEQSILCNLIGLKNDSVHDRHASGKLDLDQSTKEGGWLRCWSAEVVSSTTRLYSHAARGGATAPEEKPDRGNNFTIYALNQTTRLRLEHFSVGQTRVFIRVIKLDPDDERGTDVRIDVSFEIWVLLGLHKSAGNQRDWSPRSGHRRSDVYVGCLSARLINWAVQVLDGHRKQGHGNSIPKLNQYATKRSNSDRRRGINNAENYKTRAR